MTKQVSVQVKLCQLQSRPSFLGQIFSNLNYADRVNVIKLLKDKVEPSFSNTQSTRFQLALSNI